MRFRQSMRGEARPPPARLGGGVGEERWARRRGIPHTGRRYIPFFSRSLGHPRVIPSPSAHYYRRETNLVSGACLRCHRCRASSNGCKTCRAKGCSSLVFAHPSIASILALCAGTARRTPLPPTPLGQHFARGGVQQRLSSFWGRRPNNHSQHPRSSMPVRRRDER